MNQGEGLGPPGIQHQGVAILELAQVELAHRGGPLGAVGLAIHQEAAAAADPLAAIVLKGHWPLAGPNQLLIEHVEGLQQREIPGDLLQPIAPIGALAIGTHLPPDPQVEREGATHR